MTAAEFLLSLASRGVRLSAGEEGKLRAVAPVGALTASDKQELQQRKDEIRSWLVGLETTLAQVLAIVAWANAIRPTVRFAVLGDLAHQYHAQGDLEMLQQAVVSGRRMLSDMRK
jgi:hypothetical protein